MTVGSVSTSGSSALQGNSPPQMPKSITKDDLIRTRDEAQQSGRSAPEGIDTLIENFDEAAGSGGSMTLDQFKSYAKDNGVTLPEPGQGPAGGKGGAPAGGPSGAGGTGGASGAKGTGGSSKSSSQSSDLSTLSDAELKTKAANGSQKAIEELARRAALKGSSDSNVGTQINTYA